MIPSPTVLATLPRSGFAAADTHNDKIRTTIVNSLVLTASRQDEGAAAAAAAGGSQRHVKRRLRNEVVAACPGGNIQAYNVRIPAGYSIV